MRRPPKMPPRISPPFERLGERAAGGAFLPSAREPSTSLVTPLSAKPLRGSLVPLLLERETGEGAAGAGSGYGEVEAGMGAKALTYPRSPSSHGVVSPTAPDAPYRKCVAAMPLSPCRRGRHEHKKPYPESF
jgi:hypothetical protein